MARMEGMEREFELLIRMPKMFILSRKCKVYSSKLYKDFVLIFENKC